MEDIISKKEILSEMRSMVSEIKDDFRERIGVVDDKVTSIKATVDADHEALILAKEKQAQTEKSLDSCWERVRINEEKLWKISLTIAGLGSIAGSVIGSFIK